MNLPVLNNLNHIPKSGIRSIGQDAPPGTISLALGEPSWPPMDEANCGHPANCGHLGLNADQTEPNEDTPENKGSRNFSKDMKDVLSYGPNPGLPALRKEVADRYGVTADSVLISQGAQGALFSALNCLVSKGDCVLLPDPGFPGYKQLVHFCGGRVMDYRSFGSDSIYEEIIKASKGLKIRLIILNHPSNPTGAQIPNKEFSRILSWASSLGIWVISDEVYRHVSCQSINSNEENWDFPNLVRISSVSKACAGAGLRVGWAIANKEAIANMTTIHALTSTAASSCNQQRALQMIQSWEIHIQNTREHLAQRWHAFAHACAQHWQWVPNQPSFGFYVWLRLPRQDDFNFCLWIRDNLKVLLVPGSAFGSNGNGYCRLSFAPKPEEIELAIFRLKDVFKV